MFDYKHLEPGQGFWFFDKELDECSELYYVEHVMEITSYNVIVNGKSVTWKKWSWTACKNSGTDDFKPITFHVIDAYEDLYLKNLAIDTSSYDDDF